jgi:hypothetical protein
MAKRKQTGGIINPIQPMYNPTAADMQRQQGMMDAQQLQRTPPQSTMNKDKDLPVTKGMAEGGALKEPPAGDKGKGLKKLPTEVRNKMGFKNRGGLINNGKQDYRKSGMFYSK